MRANIADTSRGASLLPYDSIANIRHKFQTRSQPLLNVITDRDLAFAQRQEALVEYMLLKGASSNACTAEGITPLLLATVEGLPRAVEILLKHGADPNLANCEGCTPLMIASRAGNYEIVEQLLNANAVLDAQLARGSQANALVRTPCPTTAVKHR